MVQLTSDLLNGLAEKMFKLYEEKGDWDAIDTIFKFMVGCRLSDRWLVSELATLV